MVAEIHDKTEKVSQSWLTSVKAEQKSYQEQLARADQELREAKGRVGTKQAGKNFCNKACQDKEREGNARVQNLKDELDALKATIEKKQSDLQEIKRRRLEKEEKLQELRAQ